MIPASLLSMPVMTTFGWVALGFPALLRARAVPSLAPLPSSLRRLQEAAHLSDPDRRRAPQLPRGLSIAGVFLVDVRLGIAAWLAAAAHEVPQELGDFGVLIHGGWKKRTALLFNLLSGLTFLVGGLVAYAASLQLDVRWLVPLAAGNFLYIGASDLVPEVNKAHS
jgi:hypothetical protein